MKNFTPTKSLIAAAFGLALALLTHSASARAQVAAQQQPAQGQTRPAPGTRRATRPRAGNLMRQLNLSRAQRIQLRDIRRRREPETRELVRRVRLARLALDEAIYSDAAAEDSLVEQRAGELATAQAALIRLRAATELKVRRVLTAEQLQTFRELRLHAQRQLMQRRRADPDSQDAPAEPPPDLNQ